VVIEHEDIPGYMKAMTMPFFVRDTNELSGLIPGEEVRFKMIVTHDDAWIEEIEKTGNARNLLPPGLGISIASDVEPLEIGDTLPDYSLTNEFGAPIQLSQYRGKTLVLSFLFTRCPLPTFCPRLARQLAETQQTLLARENGPTNWQILAVSIDPEYDRPERLKQYGESYSYNPDHWSLATGDLTDITALGEQFGVMFWKEGGTISHNLRTVVVDSTGVIRANLIGNEWEVAELVGQVLAATEDMPEKE
jgi:protein SCO1/2